jgi:hypothetical protein
MKKNYPKDLMFLTCQVEEAKQMVELARSYGVKEVWGGGWGIDTPQVRDWFDRSFSGHGEQLLLPILGSRWKGHLRHPILIGPAEFFSFKTKVGYLYSIRGCKYKCTYCPTPAVIPTRVIMPQKEIERVLDIDEKVGAVVIYDETFLSDQPYSWQIVDMLDERGLPWFCLTSSVELNGNVSKLRDKGFLGCLMGIESLRDKTLVDYKRGRLTDLNLKVIKEMKENSCYLIGTYIFCHETDTKQCDQMGDLARKITNKYLWILVLWGAEVNNASYSSHTRTASRLDPNQSESIWTKPAAEVSTEVHLLQNQRR